jgi:hypothetical protein
MKRTLFVLLALVIAASPFALGQFQDILGPHNVNGHGCASCHTPHSGAAGQGIGGDASTGEVYLWGRDFVATTYVTIAGMSGKSYETVNGNQVTTYLATDGLSLSNDHPVHVTYAPGGYNWPGTVDATGKVVFDTVDAGTVNFTNTYGRPVRFYGVAGAVTGSAYVECSTCHNPHSMQYAKYKINNVNVVKPSRFFVRGWYDSANPASNSATQFCRSCHYSKSNEYVGINSVTN